MNDSRNASYHGSWRTTSNDENEAEAVWRLERMRKNGNPFSKFNTNEPIPEELIKEIIKFSIKNKLFQQIGKGGFGQVFLVDGKEEDSTKIVFKLAANNYKAEEEFLIQSKLVHRNIAQIFGYSYLSANYGEYNEIEAGMYFVLIMEHADAGGLDRVISENVSDKQRVDWCMDATKGLQYLHDYDPKILHRDIKPQNCLVFKNLETRGLEGSKLKLTDFGCARMTNISTVNIPNSPGWIAPEIQIELMKPSSSPHVEASDNYALGLVYLAVFSKSNLVKELGEAEMTWLPAKKKAVLDHLGVLKNSKGDLVDKFRHVIEICLQIEPSKRPTAEELLFMLKNVKILVKSERDIKNLNSKTDLPFNKLKSERTFIATPDLETFIEKTSRPVEDKEARLLEKIVEKIVIPVNESGNDIRYPCKVECFNWWNKKSVSIPDVPFPVEKMSSDKGRKNSFF